MECARSTNSRIDDNVLQNLINHESTKEALRNAQLKMEEKYPPYYWAAFVVVE